MANPNLATATNIYGGSITTDLNTNSNTIVENASSSGKMYKVHTLFVSNRSGSSTGQVTVTIGTTVTQLNIAYQLNVPPDTVIVIIGRDNPVYLKEARLIKAFAASSNTVTLTCCWDEIS